MVRMCHACWKPGPKHFSRCSCHSWVGSQMTNMSYAMDIGHWTLDIGHWTCWDWALETFDKNCQMKIQDISLPSSCTIASTKSLPLMPSNVLHLLTNALFSLVVALLLLGTQPTRRSQTFLSILILFIDPFCFFLSTCLMLLFPFSL